MKDIFKVTTRTIVAAGLGAALFALLFMFVKIPVNSGEIAHTFRTYSHSEKRKITG